MEYVAGVLLLLLIMIIVLVGVYTWITGGNDLSGNYMDEMYDDYYDDEDDYWF